MRSFRISGLRQPRASLAVAGRIRFLSALLILFLVLPTAAVAAVNPQLISYMKVEVVQTVTVTTTGQVDKLNVTLMMPQEDAFQKVLNREGSVPLSYVTDAYGNRLAVASFQQPGSSVSFTVNSIVEVNRRTSALPLTNPAFLQPTGLVESTDPDIIGLASQLTAGRAGAWDKIAAVTGWVNGNIVYDLAYAEVNASAKRTLELKRGVCDEFSALELALMRSLGYPTAYVVGYTYGRGYRVAEDFVPHGWTEVCSPSQECYVADPTWAEAGWLDAAHIKFARLPESYYIEASASALGRGQISIDLQNVDTRITILDSREEPIIQTSSSLLDSSIWNGWAVVRTDLSAPGCILTKVSTASCTRDGGSFLQPLANDSLVAFCGQGNAFSIYKAPADLPRSRTYTCPLSISPIAGRQSTVELTLDPREETSTGPSLAVDRTTVRPGEQVSARSPGNELFTSTGASGKDFLQLTAPAEDFTVYAYRDGLLAQQQVQVSEERPLEVSMQLNVSSVEIGKAVGIIVKLVNLEQAPKFVTVRIADQSRTVGLAADGSSSIELEFIPEFVHENVIQAFVESGSYSTSVAQNITVTAPPKGFVEQLIDAITGFFRDLLVALGV